MSFCLRYKIYIYIYTHTYIITFYLFMPGNLLDYILFPSDKLILMDIY